jgi:hypothetical protein
VILPLFAEGQVFLPYLKPYALLKSLEKRLNLKDEGIIVDQQTADAIDQAQQLQQEQAIQVQSLQDAAAGHEAAQYLMQSPANEQNVLLPGAEGEMT